MVNPKPVKTIPGKKLLLILGVGAVIFTLVMGFGTYFLAQLMTPFLQKASSAPKQHK